ncbi:IclR family transcriptional regulator [Paenibacillus thalictri]|uniref:Glycerol operon regulatory protein n=1 Tax=Paenibacillus thalictri TaxID=2527873 RepID=A0A4Q9DVY5_9BACL|nr:IclR family transcriptional regulator [Paenibacillus thalictri]TBL79963.1 IclR family transcriptional regulator [Paenibacillus thalictri]
MPIIQSVERALQILDLFDEQNSELKITDISKRMNLHKSTVHSLLKTLQVQRYIEQDGASGKYRLGMKLFERGNLLLQSMDIRGIARKYLLDLAANTGQTANLVLLDGQAGVYIDKVEGPRAAIRYSRIGRRIPLHCSAVGKAMAAFMGEAELKELLAGYIYEKQTAKTIGSEVEFVQELAAVRAAGVAIDHEENEPGVRCAAVPLYNYEGRVTAALSISTLTSSVDEAELDSCIALLRQAAADISAQMGYRAR